jgi:hypothetical protein
MRYCAGFDFLWLRLLSRDKIRKVQEVFWEPVLDLISLSRSDSSVMSVDCKALFYWDDAGPNMLQSL